MKNHQLKGKRGQINFTTVLIITLLCALVIFTLVYLIVNEGKKKTDIEKCRTSSMAADKIRSLSLKQIQISLDCPFSEIKIDSKLDDKFMIQKDAKYAVAKEIQTCWYKMAGDKRAQPFPESLIEFSDERWCMLCSKITFSEKVIKKGRINNFIDFLISTNVPGSKRTYFGYITDLNEAKPGVDISQKLKESKISDEINPTKEYYVIYSVARKGVWTKTTGAVVGGLMALNIALAIFPEPAVTKAGAVVLSGILIAAGAGTYKGYIIGKEYEEKSYSVMFLPKDDIEKLDCPLHQQEKK